MAESTKPRVLFALADGCEEIETIAPIDILRRAGAEVTIASVMGKDHGKKKNIITQKKKSEQKKNIHQHL